MNMLTAAREKHQGQGGHNYVRADAERIPFSTAVFDIVIAGLFDSIHDQASFFHEARRILAPGGLLIVSQPNIHSAQMVRPALGLGVAETEFHMRDGSFHRIPSVLSTPLSLDEQLAASGFGNKHILEVPAGETALTPRISQLVQKAAQKLGVEPSAVPLITVGFAVAS
ncbi:MAG TPA: class I SAM-dependent methyltransferase [Candidatus Woesebacteria bacterium]|nr:class I SAM-dependent methyltransferase [Candidatus Woesebacteria bacterium]